MSRPLTGTHIFDGLDIFPTSVLHMQLGSIPQEPIAWPRPAGEDQEGQNGSQLLGLALGWLKEDRVLRKKAEQAKGRVRGPRPEGRLLSLEAFARDPFWYSLLTVFFSLSFRPRMRGRSTRSEPATFFRPSCLKTSSLTIICVTSAKGTTTSRKGVSGAPTCGVGFQQHRKKEARRGLITWCFDAHVVGESTSHLMQSAST